MRLALALGFGVGGTRDGGQVVEIAAQEIAARLGRRAVPPFGEGLSAGAGRVKSLSAEELERVINRSQLSSNEPRAGEARVKTRHFTPGRLVG